MNVQDLSRYQDVLGQLPRLKTYTHVLLGFALTDGDTPSVVIESLEIAVRNLFDAFPWLACQVVHNNETLSNSGTFRLATCPHPILPRSIVRARDCSETLPSYQNITNARGPVAMLDGNILASVPAFPHIYDDTELNPAPVLTLQLNFLKGGVLLDVAAQHNIIDGGGLLRILEHLATSLRHEPFSTHQLNHGNRDRRNIIKLLGPQEQMLDHTHLLRESLTTTPTPAPRAPAHWAYVRFPAHTKTGLKGRANRDIQDACGAFVSTNDALCAFLWQRIASLRLRQGRLATQNSKFSRALDARRALGLPRDYLGQMGFNASCSLTFRQLQEQSLGQVALFMRRAVERVNNEYSVRSWATFVDREPDKSKIMFGGTFDPDTDVGVSSLVHASVSGVEFGSLGKPDWVRRPKFGPLEGCVYLWTETREGDVDVLMCLRDVEWDGLRADEEWVKYTEFIG
jgi:hypothetical protein